MIPYPIHIEEDDSSEYDPFLHHVIRHKLRKKKNRRRLGRLLRKHPKARLLKAIGIGRKRRRTARIGRPVRPVRRVNGHYRGRPLRNTMVSGQGNIKKPFRMPPIKFGNPMDRDVEGISKIGIKRPYRKGPPIMLGDPSNRPKSPVFVSKPPLRKQPSASKDIVIPYKRRYGSGRPKSVSQGNKQSNREIMTVTEETPVMTQELGTSNTAVMKDTKENQQPQTAPNKNNMRNIIGVAVLGLVVAGFVMYKMKSKIGTNGRTG